MNAAAPASARLLLVEDDPGLATLLSTLLCETGHRCEVADSGARALERLQTESFDLALLDYALPDMAASELVPLARQRNLLPPFIVLTGHGDERVAVELMKLGARDYLIKDANLLHRLSGIVNRILEELRIKRQLDQTELALKQSGAELASIYDHAPSMMILVDAQGRIRRLNRAAIEFSPPRSPQELPSDLGEFLCCARDQGQILRCGSAPSCAACGIHQALGAVFQSGQTQRRIEVKLKLQLGNQPQERTLRLSTTPVGLQAEPLALLCLEDITEQKRVEELYRQSQKMEAIGQLAGGVAHDFNNILTGILMQVGMLRGDTALPERMRSPLEELEDQAKRAASLTRQLLLFSRRQAMDIKPADLNKLLENMLKMLRRLLGEHIDMEFCWQSPLPPVQADVGMIEQVVMNLCVNARDAMPKGGRLSLSTAVVELAFPPHPDTPPTPFVLLKVTDTGCGMDHATLARIFEPFFTTKEAGKGTGLGLATVFGIIKQHRGWIEVKSAPGQGSTFLVYLPVSTQQSPPSSGHENIRSTPRGHETILVVEDESNVRLMTANVLRNQGYRVLEAANGQEALNLWAQCGQTIDLLFSDVIMPGGLNGLELATCLRAQKPSLKVILFSGYSVDLLGGNLGAIPAIHYLAKPCTPSAMARSVRDCLDQAFLADAPAPGRTRELKTPA